jgi:hypothetical protein
MKINDITNITENHAGFWLYDKSRGMHLAMRSESERAALIEALEYYQRRFVEVETDKGRLQSIVNSIDILINSEVEVLI